MELEVDSVHQETYFPYPDSADSYQKDLEEVAQSQFQPQEAEDCFHCYAEEAVESGRAEAAETGQEEEEILDLGEEGS
jgi:hypothetical protein